MLSSIRSKRAPHNVLNTQKGTFNVLIDVRAGNGMVSFLFPLLSCLSPLSSACTTRATCVRAACEQESFDATQRQRCLHLYGWHCEFKITSQTEMVKMNQSVGMGATSLKGNEGGDPTNETPFETTCFLPLKLPQEIIRLIAYHVPESERQCKQAHISLTLGKRFSSFKHQRVKLRSALSTRSLSLTLCLSTFHLKSPPPLLRFRRWSVLNLPIDSIPDTQCPEKRQ